ncbi:MAG: heavy metal translocating P-type ATPase [Wenzhouxiangellaceae bacterium]|nr:heavy metal translocating P-type ATPase [Wenzhouxiangellaceae bacterium]
MNTVEQKACFHCGEPVPDGTDLAIDVDGQARSMCCAGCRAVASLIHSAGLDRYYDFRDALPDRPDQDAAQDLDPGRFAAWDRDAVLDFHAPPEKPAENACANSDARAIVLVLENVHCAACAWLLQRYLGQFPGVGESRLDVGDGRLRLVFEPARTPLSQLAAALQRLGYPPHLDTPDSGIDRDRNERRRMQRYLIVAGLGMMQVMSYALANYIGAFQGMEPEIRHFFKLISMLVAVPVALYAGQPFYRSALRHLSQRHLGLDVPVAAAIMLALFASVVMTLFGHAEGEVYFDSVVMFIFFLLLGRFAVMIARQQSSAVHSALARALPGQARRITEAGSEQVGLVELQPGDRVMVADGEIIPADGEVIGGTGRVDESLLSGESEPRRRRLGESVLAGSLVSAGSLEIRIEAVGRATILSGIVELLSEARRRRPRLAQMADRAAGWFIGLILVSTGIAALAWWSIDPAQVIPITLAMLVVACPCALALGTPTALASATRGLAANGILTANPDALEALPGITHVVFDKTGTLTRPTMQIAEVRCRPGLGRASALAICAALERVSSHPIASAFRTFDDGRQIECAESLGSAGVSAVVDGQRYWLGRPDWVAAQSGQSIDVPQTGLWLALACASEQPAVMLRLDNSLREGSRRLVADLKRRGLTVILASGDREANVADMARALDIPEFHARLEPAGKLALVHQLQQAGAVVAMIGDGINDAPVLAGADISIALAEGAAIARTQADLVATGRNLKPLLLLFGQAPRVRRIIRQNLAWALAYNISALPLAAMGLIPPWAAAIGMSASSLGVVLNARRLGRLPDSPGDRSDGLGRPIPQARGAA